MMQDTKQKLNYFQTVESYKPRQNKHDSKNVLMTAR